eukprot:Clim_evm21s243 gene=Clim_evmTU21s243
MNHGGLFPTGVPTGMPTGLPTGLQPGPGLPVDAVLNADLGAIHQGLPMPQTMDPHREGSSLESQSAGKPRRRRGYKIQYLACNNCRRMKIRCDGETRCKNCIQRNKECVYDKDRRRKARDNNANKQSNNSEKVVARHPTFELAKVSNQRGLVNLKLNSEVVSSALEKFYENIFFQYCNPFASSIFGAQTKIGSGLPISLANQVQTSIRSAVLAHAARACGEHKTSEHFIMKARHVSREIFDVFCRESVTAFTLLADYYVCHNGPLSSHYGNIAQGLLDETVNIEKATARRKQTNAIEALPSTESKFPNAEQLVDEKNDEEEQDEFQASVFLLTSLYSPNPNTQGDRVENIFKKMSVSNTRSIMADDVPMPPHVGFISMIYIRFELYKCFVRFRGASRCEHPLLKENDMTVMERPLDFQHGSGLLNLISKVARSQDIRKSGRCYPVSKVGVQGVAMLIAIGIGDHEKAQEIARGIEHILKHHKEKLPHAPIYCVHGVLLLMQYQYFRLGVKYPEVALEALDALGETFDLAYVASRNSHMYLGRQPPRKRNEEERIRRLSASAEASPGPPIESKSFDLQDRRVVTGGGAYVTPGGVAVKGIDPVTGETETMASEPLASGTEAHQLFDSTSTTGTTSHPDTTALEEDSNLRSQRDLQELASIFAGEVATLKHEDIGLDYLDQSGNLLAGWANGVPGRPRQEERDLQQQQDAVSPTAAANPPSLSNLSDPFGFGGSKAMNAAAMQMVQDPRALMAQLLDGPDVGSANDAAAMISQQFDSQNGLFGEMMRMHMENGNGNTSMGNMFGGMSGQTQGNGSPTNRTDPFSN